MANSINNNKEKAITALPPLAFDPDGYVLLTDASGTTGQAKGQDLVYQVQEQVESSGALADAIEQVNQLVQEGFDLKGSWNVATNTPNLSTIEKEAGDAWSVLGPGTTSITGTPINAIDSDIFQWNGTVWVYRPKALIPADSSVNFKKTDMFGPGRNRFNVLDPDNITGFFIDTTTGALTANVNQNTTHYIPVSGSEKIAVHSGSAQGARIAWYDVNKTFISGVLTGLAYETSPSNAKFARVSVNTTNLPWAGLQVEAGVLKTYFRPFRQFMRTSQQVPLVANALAESTVLSPVNLSLTTGKNLFNPASPDVFMGQFINGDKIEANAAYNVTHEIPVTPGLFYTVSTKHILGWYDSAGGYLSGSPSSDLVKNQQAPAGAAYLRCTVPIANWSTFQVEAGSTPTAFESFRYVSAAINGVDIYASKALLASLATLATSAEALNATFPLTAANMRMVASKNLFNAADPDVALDKFINYTTGAALDNVTYNATGFIPVTAGQQYTLSYKNQIAFYTASKVYISGDNTANKTVTAPGTAAFMRCTVIKASWPTFQVELGATQTYYEAFGKVFKTIDGLPMYADKAIYATNAGTATLANTLDATFALSPANMNLAVGKNLFNPGDPDVKIDFYVDYSNGNTTANTQYNATGYIPVVAGQTYTLSYKHQIAWYNSSKVYITGSNSSDLVATQTAPAGAAYLRCTVIKASWPTFQVELGSVATSWEEYAWYIKTIGGVKIIPSYVAAVPETVTAPVIAPKIYVPRKTELSIYFENVCKYFEKEGKGKTDVTVTGALTGELTLRGRSTKFKQGTSNNALVGLASSIRSYGVNFDLLNTLGFTLQPVNETLTTAKTIVDLGDSYALRSTFVNKVMAAAGTGLTFLGMRKSTAATTQVNHEGRGGWTMANYHTVNTTLFHPFMQPQNPYKYYGNTSYWINAVNNPVIGAANENYDWGNVDPAIRALYDGTTGLLIAPAVDNVMYVNSASEYRRWTGSAWVTVTGLTFTFDFAKYRSLYSFAAVDVFHVMLGINDFSLSTVATFNSSYPTFKTRMDTMFTSYRADNATGKFIIGIPPSSGKQGPYGTADTERRKLMYWLLAQKLVADYGNREGEGILLSDYHSTVDREFGYDPQAVLPFADYTGTQRDLYIADFVHLSADGFKQMGDIYYGTIQACR